MIESMATPLPVEVVREEDGSGTRTSLEHVASLATLEAAPSGWTWDEVARGMLWIKLPAGAARALIR